MTLFCRFNVRVGILITCGMHCIVSLRGQVWVHKTSLTPTFVTEVSVPSKKREHSCICELGVSILPFSAIFLLDIGTVVTVWYFCFSFYD
jgi:hypothetical protein